MELKRCLSEVTDFRRKKGQRHSLSQMFSMLLISGLCGQFGGRAVARFTAIGKEVFMDRLGLKHVPPSHVSFSHFLNNIDHEKLTDAFNKWTSNYEGLSEAEAISGDGKALRSTASENGNRFCAVVTLFSQQTGLAHRIATYKNNKKSEIHVITALLKELDKMGLTIYLDALHCQKKQSKQ